MRLAIAAAALCLACWPVPTAPAERPAPCWRSLGVFSVRAYCKCKKCCGIWSRYHTTKGGIDIATWRPVVAVDPAVIPLGTRLWVDGVGARLASDTGPNCKGRRMELLMPGPVKVAHQRALRWGVRRLEVWREEQ